MQVSVESRDQSFGGFKFHDRLLRVFRQLQRETF